MMLSSNSTGKYIPPHRRRELANLASGSTARQAEPVLFSSSAPRSFSAHALIRREQRDISYQSINEAVKTGISLEHNQSTTHIDETTQVVMARNGKVITVVDNKRNSNFDAMRFSREKEQSLIRKAERHNDSAMCELAELYLSGELGTREVQKAYHWLLRAANDKKNSHAMCLLSSIHGSGDLGTPDPAGALLWLERAAERNNRYALAVLGQRCLSTYLEMKERGDIEESKKIEIKRKTMFYLNQSANKGSTRAMWQLGQIAAEGWFGEKDLVTAVEIYTKAGKLGSPASLDSLNELVSAGVVSEQHLEGVLAIASELVARTSSELAVDLGLKQIEGLLGKNPERGLKMIEQAAQQRNVNAIKVLAKCYENGKGCTINLSTSRYWFEKLGELYGDAGRNGNVDALFDLGRLFLSGKLGEIDLEKARQHLVKASQEADNPKFSYYLGRLYIEGCLGNYSPSEGIVWINKAIMLWTKQASEGDIEAIYELVSIYLNKDLSFKDYAKAISWLTILTKKQISLAMLMLSNIYLKKKPQYRNVSQAIELLYLASSMQGEQNSIKESKIKLEILLDRQDWSAAEREEIVRTMLKLAGETEEERPYKIGRILGDIFSKGSLLPPDFEKAFFWYEKSAGFENSVAMFRLGELCQMGALGTINLSKAVEWYDLSAKMGNEKAIIQLHRLKDSKDLSNDAKLIIQPWLDKYEIEELEIEPSIAEDDEDSVKQQEKLEALYQMGLEEKAKNPQLAVCKLRKAAKEGDFPAANFELGEIYSSGVLGEKVLPVAMLFYKRAGRQKHPEAVEKLVNHYTDGKLVAPNLSKSEKWKSRLVKK